MTIDEAIKHFEAQTQCNYKPAREAAELAIAALRAQQEPNDPLTLEELREMDGEPVYLDFGGLYGEYALVRVEKEVAFLRHKNGILSPAKLAFECAGQIYRRKPEEV